MATITLTIGALSKTFTLSAADVTRVTDAFKATYGASLSNAQVFDIWANSTMQALKDVVKRVEGDAAAQAARNAISDVAVT